MTEIFRKNRLDTLGCVCWFMSAVAFLLDGNYLMAFLATLLFVGNIIQLYLKVKKSKEYDKD